MGYQGKKEGNSKVCMGSSKLTDSSKNYIVALFVWGKTFYISQRCGTQNLDCEEVFNISICFTKCDIFSVNCFTKNTGNVW